jgi:hypothetical protein
MGRAMKDINKTLKETKTMNFGTSAMPPPPNQMFWESKALSSFLKVFEINVFLVQTGCGIALASVGPARPIKNALFFECQE